MATIPSYRTWVVGEIVTAAEMNSQVTAAGNFLIAPPIAELRGSTATSLATSGTFGAIGFQSSDVDSDGGHSNTTNNSRYTAQTSGWFQFDGGIGFASNATGLRASAWYKNGSATNGSQLAFSASAGDPCIPARTKKIQMSAVVPDYVELFGFQSSGGALSTSTTAVEQPTMSVRWISQ